MTRGRCSSLRLHRDGLAPSTFRRSPGAPAHTWSGASSSRYSAALLRRGRSRRGRSQQCR